MIKQTKTIIFESEINKDSVQELIDNIEDNIEKEITIYFTTSGGNNSDTLSLISFLENTDADITLVGTWGINSNGFILFYRLIKLKRKLAEDVYASVHLSYREISTNNILKDKDDADGEKFYLEILKKRNEINLKFYEQLGLTPAELKKIKKGYSVLLGRDRLLEILEKQEITNV